MQSSREDRTISRDVRFVIHPSFSADDGIDVTESVTDAIAQEIERRNHGNRLLNRLEAEILLADFLHRRASSDEAHGTGAASSLTAREIAETNTAAEIQLT